MKRFRIGVVGAGLIARDHALSLRRMPEVEALSFFDAAPERAAQLAAEFGGRVASDLDELVAGCDVVWICTPPFARRAAIEAACAAGRAIFCEKPLALSAADAAWIQHTVRAAGVPFFMGQSNRFLAVFRQMKALLDAGEIGTPTSIWSTRLGWLDAAASPAWRLDDAKGGGVLVELGIHEIDFIRWLSGDWQSVYARGASAVIAPGRFLEAASGIGTLQNGLTARLDVSWASPRYLWQRGVEGTTGSLFFDDRRITQIELNRFGKEPQLFPVGNWQDEQTGENLSLREQAHTVLRTLAENGAPPVTLEDGLAALQVALAIRKSVQSGAVIPLENS